MTYDQNVANIAEILAKRHHQRNNVGRGIWTQVWEDIHQSVRDKYIQWNVDSAKDMLKEQEMEVRYLMGCQGEQKEKIELYLIRRGLIPNTKTDNDA